MTTLRHMYWMTILAPAILVLAQPAAAQTDEPPDTVFVDAGETVIILDGKRIVVKSMDTGEGRQFTLEKEDFDFPGMLQGDKFDFDIETHRRELAKSKDLIGSLGNQIGEMKVMMTGLEGSVRGLEREAQRLARAVRSAEGDVRTRLNDELVGKLGEIFDRKQELRQERIDRLQSQLNKAVEEREERERVREEIIRRRMDQLVGNARYEW